MSKSRLAIVTSTLMPVFFSTTLVEAVDSSVYVATCRTKAPPISAISYSLEISVVPHVKQTYRVDIVTTTDMCWGGSRTGCGGDVTSEYDTKIAKGPEYTSLPNLKRLEWVGGHLEFSEWQGNYANGRFSWNGNETNLICEGKSPQ